MILREQRLNNFDAGSLEIPNSEQQQAIGNWIINTVQVQPTRISAMKISRMIAEMQGLFTDPPAYSQIVNYQEKPFGLIQLAVDKIDKIVAK